MATTNRGTSGGRPQSSKPTTDVLDPLDLNGRLYRQLGKLLDDMEAADRDDRMSMPQRIQGLVAIARVQVVFANLRKLANNEPGGSEVRRYAAAFKAPYGARRRETSSGGPELVDLDSDGDDDGGSDDAA